jgi:hypothetical protein
MTPRKAMIAALACALVAPSAAAAANYPPPSNPGKPGTAPKNTKTLKVCKHGKRCFKTIQKAVNTAGRGDTIKIANGTYHEAVQVTGHKKDFLHFVGNAKSPRKVLVDVKGAPKSKRQNAVLVNGANSVSIDGMSARNYTGNGFFLVNVTGYTINHVIAEGPIGVYGVYAFNSKGGKMLNSEAYYHNDGGFYIGQTPKQAKPRRSIVRNIKSWGNAIGWSGTNMRYVTITKSEFFNNAIGMIPNALSSEKFPPAEHNVIADNDIFWNNFNYYAGAPFKAKKFGGEFNLPPGLGIVLLGSRTARVENNRIYGNYLSGFGMVIDFAISDVPDAADPRQNEIVGNDFGLGGSDLNGRDMSYDGSGTGNCFSGNTLTAPTLPADGNTFAECPGPDPNHKDDSVLAEAVKWLNDETHEAYWVKNPHAAHKGYNPLEHWTKDFKPGGGL